MDVIYFRCAFVTSDPYLTFSLQLAKVYVQPLGTAASTYY